MSRARRIYGVRWVVGIPQSGKTTLAKHLAAELARERGCPVLVIDSAEVWNLTELPARRVEDAIATLWRAPRASVRVVPRGVEDVDRLCKAVRAGKDVVLFVDEAHFWLSAQSGSSTELGKVMRAAQHSRCDLILTSQHLTGDVPQSVLSCTSELYVFRCTSPRVLECLKRDFNVEPATVRSLPQFRCLRKVIGFQ